MESLTECRELQDLQTTFVVIWILSTKLFGSKRLRVSLKEQLSAAVLPTWSAARSLTLKSAVRGKLPLINFYRLKTLLDAEDRMYEEEFMANLETPEQVR